LARFTPDRVASAPSSRSTTAPPEYNGIFPALTVRILHNLRRSILDQISELMQILVEPNGLSLFRLFGMAVFLRNGLTARAS
jgi:hypothetical protein